MPLQLPTSQLHATVLSLHIALWNLNCNSSLVKLAFISLLSPSNLGANSLPLGSSLWLTLTDTDHSYSSSGWPGTSASKFFHHSGSCCNYFLSLSTLYSFLLSLEGIQEIGESPEGKLLLWTVADPFRFLSGLLPEVAVVEWPQGVPWEVRFCKWELSPESL